MILWPRAVRGAAGLAVAACLAACGGGGPPDPILRGGPAVRVQVVSDQSGPVPLSAQGPVRISTLPDLVLRYEGPLPDPVLVAAEGEGFRIAGQFYPSPLRVSSPSGRALSLKPSAGASAARASRTYRGVLDLLNLGGRIRVINEVSLEEYLASVVGGEMLGGFPAAALESQAIASRTYTLYQLRAGRERPLRDGFSAGPDFQTYRGLGGENPAARHAVRATAGWVLTYQGKLLPAYYHSTCGGSTTSGSAVFGHEEVPPLRGVPCSGCVSSPSHRWSLALPLSRIEAALRPWAQARGIPLGALVGLEGVEALPGGYLPYLRVRHAGGQFEIRSDRFRGLLLKSGISGLKSTAFEIAKGAEPGTLDLRGSGWGHGVGLCQYGAAHLGGSWTHGEILAHYFPESELKKVY